MTLLDTETITLTLEPTAGETVGELVVAAQQGDREAFGRLVERFERSVFATAMRRLRNHAEAQELTQEVFVQALRKIEQLREPGAFGGWLKSITVRMAINRASRGAPDASTEPGTLAATCVENQTPLAEADLERAAPEVRASLRRLRPLDRKTLVAFYLEGQSLIEMSNAFDSPVGTIKRRLHVARKRLARELEELATV